MKKGSKAQSPASAMALLLLGGFAFAGAVSVSPRPQANRPKPKVTWGKDFNFHVTYSRSQILKPVVVPSSLAQKMTWTSDDPDALLLPSASQYDYRYDIVSLPVVSKTDLVCHGAASIIPKLHGISVANFAAGSILRPHSTSSQILYYGRCIEAAGGGRNLWRITLRTNDPGAPNFTGVTLTEQLESLQNPCGLSVGEIAIGDATVGPSPASRSANSFDDNTKYCVAGSYPGPNCTSTFSQSWKLGQCETFPANITFAFAASSVTITRGDGGGSIGPIGPGPEQ